MHLDDATTPTWLYGPFPCNSEHQRVLLGGENHFKVCLNGWGTSCQSATRGLERQRRELPVREAE
jgi:hypothetical protein